MPKIQKAEVDEKYGALKQEISRMKPLSHHQVDPGPRVLDAVQAGEEIVASKAWHSGPGAYQPGDVIDVEKLGLQKLAVMAKHGFCRPASEWNSMAKHNSLVDLANKAEPKKMELDRARSDAVRTAAQIAVIKAQLIDAENIARTKAAYCEKLENDLLEILSGEDVSQLLASVEM